MTAKTIKNFQTISIRPQNELEKMVIENIQALVISGKKPFIKIENGDLILEIKSEK